MFTLEMIQAAHSQVKTGADFPNYVQALKAMGLDYYDYMVADGSTMYYGTDGTRLVQPARYSPLHVAPAGDAAQLAHIIRIHQQGQTDFLTFCSQAAQAGVHKWATRIQTSEVVYTDLSGTVLLSEPIPGGGY